MKGKQEEKWKGQKLLQKIRIVELYTRNIRGLEL